MMCPLVGYKGFAIPPPHPSPKSRREFGQEGRTASSPSLAPLLLFLLFLLLLFLEKISF